MTNRQGGILLDTHIWVWIETGDSRISASLRRLLETAAVRGTLYVSAISLLEIANLQRRNRISLHIPLDRWFEQTLSGPGVNLLNITPAIAVETMHLPREFHGDPADRLLAATARVERLDLCTYDRELLRFGQQGIFKTLKV